MHFDGKSAKLENYSQTTYRNQVAIQIVQTISLC